MSNTVSKGSFAHPSWQHAHGAIELDRPKVAAIVNLTPDSFYDGGRWCDGQDSASRFDALVGRWMGCGAALIDVGAESTRPGSKPIGASEEMRRLEICFPKRKNKSFGLGTPVSVDTQKADVARFSLSLGADIINDVSGLSDPAMADVVAEFGAGLVIGHMRGTPENMQVKIGFSDLVHEVIEELCQSIQRARKAGVALRNIVVDPGIGFGKTTEQCIELIDASQDIAVATGCPVMIGASRKSFLGKLTEKPVGERLASSLAIAMVAAMSGASVLRVHDVEETLDVLRIFDAFVSGSNLKECARRKKM